MKTLTVSLLMLLGSMANAAASLTPEQKLGAQLYKDKNLSLNRNQSCATCHSLNPLKMDGQTAPSFVDPKNVLNKSAVSKGSKPKSFGSLNAMSVGYAAFSPSFYWDETKKAYIGGQFWNGRAKDLVEQAKGPFLNSAEMAMPKAWAVVNRLQENPNYVSAFKTLYSLDMSTIPAYDSQLPEPSEVAPIYDKLASSIAAFEKTAVFNKFTSKLDYVFAGKTTLSAEEKLGMTLFRGRARCVSCHTDVFKFSNTGVVLVPSLFSNFAYENLGLPRNVNIPKKPAPNLGLGERDDIRQIDPDNLQMGKHKVMSLRNVALTAPYEHNGVFKTLAQVVHFYNTRDTLGVVADNNDPGFGITGWPKAEVPININGSIGNLNLSTDEEKAIVAFLKTLTDDYPKWGNDPRVPVGSAPAFSTIVLP